jgi:mannose-6-phosphate isomerase-like protein (cupin superfamily)
MAAKGDIHDRGNGSGVGEMRAGAFDTRTIAAAADTLAPDGSEVRLLCTTAGGSMAAFRLAPGAVARAVAHRTVDEIWYVAAGEGRIWRQQGDAEAITGLAAGLSLTIPCGTRFQFRCDGATPLDILAVTMPPWPGEGEAYTVEGVWPPSL